MTNFRRSRCKRQVIGRRITARKSYNGVAILAKTELREIRPSLCDEVVDPQARVIAASIGRACACSRFTRQTDKPSAHLAYEYKLQWYRRLRDCVAKEKSADVVVCGDFNVAPEDIDVYDAELWRGAIMASDGERAAFRELWSLGLRDTLRIHHKEGGLFSWWDYQMRGFEKNRGLRIDAVLASDSLAKNCVASGIDREMRGGKDPSDHAPVWAEFRSDNSVIPSEVEGSNGITASYNSGFFDFATLRSE